MTTMEEIQRLCDPELWLVTGSHEGRHGGLIASFVVNASIVPEMPRYLVGIAKQHHTFGLVEGSGALAMHLLPKSRFDWVTLFGLKSGRDVDKLAGIDWSPGPETGSPILADAVCWLDCRVETYLDTGDRHVYLAEVRAADCPGEGPVITGSDIPKLCDPQSLAAMGASRDQHAKVDAAAIAQWRNSG